MASSSGAPPTLSTMSVMDLKHELMVLNDSSFVFNDRDELECALKAARRVESKKRVGPKAAAAASSAPGAGALPRDGAPGAPDPSAPTPSPSLAVSASAPRLPAPSVPTPSVPPASLLGVDAEVPGVRDLPVAVAVNCSTKDASSELPVAAAIPATAATEERGRREPPAERAAATEREDDGPPSLRGGRARGDGGASASPPAGRTPSPRSTSSHRSSPRESGVGGDGGAPASPPAGQTPSPRSTPSPQTGDGSAPRPPSSVVGYGHDAPSAAVPHLNNDDETDDARCQSVAQSTLAVLVSRIEEARANFTRALREGDVERQAELAGLMTRLGEAAVAMRKLERVR